MCNATPYPINPGKLGIDGLWKDGCGNRTMGKLYSYGPEDAKLGSTVPVLWDLDL